MFKKSKILKKKIKMFRGKHTLGMLKLLENLIQLYDHFDYIQLFYATILSRIA